MNKWLTTSSLRWWKRRISLYAFFLPFHSIIDQSFHVHLTGQGGTEVSRHPFTFTIRIWRGSLPWRLFHWEPLIVLCRAQLPAVLCINASGSLVRPWLTLIGLMFPTSDGMKFWFYVGLARGKSLHASEVPIAPRARAMSRVSCFCNGMRWEMRYARFCCTLFMWRWSEMVWSSIWVIQVKSTTLRLQNDEMTRASRD